MSLATIGITAVPAHNLVKLRQKLERYQHDLKKAFELYEEALDESCTCYDEPDRGCPRCSKTMRARKLAESVIGEYEQA